VKTQFTITLGGLAEKEQLGYYFSDRAPVSNDEANVFTEPDGTFCSFRAIENGRVRLVEGADVGHVEIEGAPDMVLEVISTSSIRKDTKILRGLYWRAGIPEYWLVDARKEPIQFDILRWTARGYASTRARHGWLKSKVFRRFVQIQTKVDRLGHPQFSVRLRTAEPS